MTNSDKFKLIIIIIAIIITLLTIIIKPEEEWHEFNYNNNTDDFDSVYLTISNVYLSSSSSYNTCYGTISVLSSSPYKYHLYKS